MCLRFHHQLTYQCCWLLFANSYTPAAGSLIVTNSTDTFSSPVNVSVLLVTIKLPAAGVYELANKVKLLLVKLLAVKVDNLIDQSAVLSPPKSMLTITSAPLVAQINWLA